MLVFHVGLGVNDHRYSPESTPDVQERSYQRLKFFASFGLVPWKGGPPRTAKQKRILSIDSNSSGISNGDMPIDGRVRQKSKLKSTEYLVINIIQLLYSFV